MEIKFVVIDWAFSWRRSARRSAGTSAQDDGEFDQAGPGRLRRRHGRLATVPATDWASHVVGRQSSHRAQGTASSSDAAQSAR